MCYKKLQQETEGTRMGYMISSTTIPTVCLKIKSDNFQGRTMTSMTPSSQNDLSDIICYVNYDSTAKFIMYFNFTTIKYGRQIRSRPIFETEGRTEFWLPYNIVIAI